MRILKLVIWDLDETILTGILEEGDEEINPTASKVMRLLDERGILQALATQNPPDVIPAAIQKFGWSGLFVHVEADLGPKARKVKRILDILGVNPLDTAFVDEDPFERGSISAQIADINACSIADLEAYLEGDSTIMTEEARRRPQMYREQQARIRGEEDASEYADFLRSCNIQITVRPYLSEDAMRAEELLTRTHRMNLGVLPIAYAKLVRRFQQIFSDSGIPLHFSFVSERTYQREQKQTPQSVLTIPLFVKPLNLELLAQTYFTSKWKGFVVDRVGRVMSPFLFRQRPPASSGTITLQVVDQFAPDFNEFWLKVRDKYPGLFRICRATHQM